ncbi:MAG: FHA domain-containing protein [Planctomycetota bacterium]|nr:FHA domain-containing protein [Planctomycetota bacterium]
MANHPEFGSDNLSNSAAMRLPAIPFPNFPLSPIESNSAKFQVFPALIYPDDRGSVQTTLLLKKEMLLGSDASCDIILAELQAKHCRLRVSKTSILLTTVNDEGISVNEQKVSRAELQPGDSIRIGRYLFCLALKVKSEGSNIPNWEAFPRSSQRGKAHDSPLMTGQGLELLTRIREIREFSHRAMEIFQNDPDDYEGLLEFAGLELIELFSAARVFVVLFEEDGQNPVLTVKKYRKGYEPLEPDSEMDPDTASNIADATQMEINDTLLRRTVMEKTLIRLDQENDGQSTSSKEGLSVPILHENRVLGLLYFDRPIKEPIREIEEDLFDLVARLLAHPFSHFVD